MLLFNGWFCGTTPELPNKVITGILPLVGVVTDQPKQDVNHYLISDYL